LTVIFVPVRLVFSLMKTIYRSKHVKGTYDYLLLIVQFVGLNTVLTILGATTLVSSFYGIRLYYYWIKFPKCQKLHFPVSERQSKRQQGALLLKRLKAQRHHTFVIKRLFY